MPIYEYRCEGCQEVFSVIKISATSGKQVTCPKCGGSQVNKLMSTFSSSGAGGGLFGGGGGSPFGGGGGGG